MAAPSCPLGSGRECDGLPLGGLGCPLDGVDQAVTTHRVVEVGNDVGALGDVVAQLGVCVETLIR